MNTDAEIRRVLFAQPIFSGVDPGIVEAFAARCRMNIYPAGTLLLKQGQRGDVLMLLVSGAVHFRCQLGARSTTLAILREPTLFSLGAIIEKTGAMADAFALDSVQVVSVDGVVVRELMLADARFATNLAVQLSGNVRGFVQSAVEQKLLTGPKRLANFLAQEFERQGQTTEIELPFQRQVIASLLGMTPENLSRAFDVLERHGVRNDRVRVAVESIDDLVAFGKG
ncbi:MAG: helix-turn-helix domain-containing protein [Alphaproteobacteria bacterium]|uniref:helix-turn-helix domain-containing protein n=1 Tax=Brevundimonas sp. TaxID=1871086 RepID=UPI00183D1A79|nr:helix-turn-helix domain-containing protein [Brevundimonas sp.]MBA3049667.1 cyclic nucleotide-binding domain-containing protein [Brevundimonas sp.]MBU3974690.1 helix-turn-helix domain-containing protein [Alphaproteobacteria bacterium]MBU4040431.1 helix-turn-helix domain-containing protein [Alphaproteobacteria bacterium]MBU4136830.1 helix-turn-helix domain-containing protein [Alphaproteobacteria bacterium]